MISVWLSVLAASRVVSTQVLQELAVNLRKKAKKPLDAKGARDVSPTT